jgi:hypothetical protein
MMVVENVQAQAGEDDVLDAIAELDPDSLSFQGTVDHHLASARSDTSARGDLSNSEA